MNKLAIDLEYTGISLRIKNGKANDRDFQRMKLIEANLKAIDLQKKLDDNYNQDLISQINALNIKIQRMEKSWEDYKVVDNFKPTNDIPK